jgi:hypothetical protein
MQAQDITINSGTGYELSEIRASRNSSNCSLSLNYPRSENGLERIDGLLMP